MKTEYHTKKSLGPQGAKLLSALHARHRSIFSLKDVQESMALAPVSARIFIARLVQRGIVARLKPGLFILIPFELGNEREYLGNQFVVARELAEGREYALSHASALDLHGMTTQPQLVVHVTSPHPFRARNVFGTPFHFIQCKPQEMFGIEDHWVSKTEKVLVTDLERTILDGLKMPQYCGGITEVAKGFTMRRRDFKIPRMVDYALRLGVGAVIRRLGFLLETFGVDAPTEIARLHSKVSPTYHLLDPTQPAEGNYLARWGVRLNVSPEELQAVGGS